MNRNLLNPLLLLLCMPLWSVATDSAAHKIKSPLQTARPFIESILHNPAVEKKALAGNVTQAVGYYRTGTPQFVIHFRKGRLQGAWQSFYNNQQRCDSGAFEKSLPTGAWKTWYPNGQLKTVRTYSAAKYQYIKADRQRNHPKDQRYALTALSATEAAHFFKPAYGGGGSANNAISLLQKIEHNTFAQDAYVPPFADCLHHGAFVNYAADGRVLDSGYYANGLPQGLWKETVPTQNVYAVGFYRQGKRNGQWKYYDAENRLVYTEHYNASGMRTGQHHFKN